jgi:ABC-type branched-subunit amino acid transport system substrate-binding protein
MRVLAALAAAAALAGCGSVPNSVTGGGRVVGDNLTVYASVPDPARGVGRDMVDASKLAIAQAGGRVGDFGINFVAVDEGSPGKPDPPRLAAAAAEQVIRDAQVIAVVGAVRSDTALTSLPLFNAAGILLVSPGAGYAGFTAPVAAGEPDRWYPSGRPTFARMIEDDTEQAQALLRAAGRGKVAIEGEVGKVASEQVEALQQAGGDRIVEDVRRADAVIYVGSELANARGVAESLVREVPKARLVFGDELTRAGLPRRLDPAALRRAVFVTAAPEPGSEPEFEAAFEQELGRAPDPYAALTWRATRGVLDALAAAGRRANLRRVVTESFLASPPAPSGFRAFRLRDGEREYL